MFAIYEDAGQFCIEVFFFRTFQNWGNRAYFPRADQAASSSGEVLGAFVAQFYDERPAARAGILLDRDFEDRELLAAALGDAPGTARRGRGTTAGRAQANSSITPPTNARETLTRRLDRNMRARRSCSASLGDHLRRR